MPPTDSTLFTNKHVDSFDGALLTISTTPCDPTPYRWRARVEPKWPRRFVFPLTGSETGGYSACLDVWLGAPPDQVEFTREDWDRLTCLLLVSRLKARGLGEAIESLRGMVEFYDEEPIGELPSPPARLARTKVVGSYTSTVPPLDEE